jgi:quercetin dioxygenase-like cupin family protein
MGVNVHVRLAGEGESSPDPVGRPRLIKASPLQTDGAYTLTQSTRQPGLGAPQHVHAEHEEAFYILRGELTFEIDGRERVVASEGAFVLVPRGVRHSFEITSDSDASYLCIFSPPVTEQERNALTQQLQHDRTGG